MCDSGDAAIGQQILRMNEQGTPFLVERPALGRGADADAGAGQERSSGEIGPKARVQVKLEDGRISLERYQPDLTQVQERDRETVARYINENSLALISFWSIDPAFDGSVHNCRELLAGEDTAVLPKKGEEDAAGGDGAEGGAGDRGDGAGARAGISIVGYDLFGGRFEWRN